MNDDQKTKEELIKELEATNEKLKVQSIDEDLKPLVEELDQLKGEKKIFDYKPKLAREIYRQKKVRLLNQCQSRCNTRTITILSNDGNFFVMFPIRSRES